MLLVMVAVRLPLHRATFSLPVSNDDAIPLLMARHVQRGELSTILWNQPYNGTLDTYLLAPLTAVLGEHDGFRVYEAACGIALVALVGLLAGLAAGEGAGWAAALLAAAGTPYMALMAATGPTPNFLVPLLTGVAAAAGLRGVRRPGALVLVGVLSGLAVWDSALALPALLGVAAGLAAAGRRPALRPAAALAAGFALGASPLLLAHAIGASAASPVTAVRPRWLWLDGLSDLLRAAGGLLGVQVPLVVDGPERADLPLPLAAALAAGLGVLVLRGALPRAAWPLVGWALALSAAFAASRRTGGDEIRYLFGLVAPVLALAGVGLAALLDRHRRPARARTVVAIVLAAAVVTPWIRGHRILAGHWRDPRHAARVWQVPPLEPVLETLARAGIRSAYASLQFAGRLAVESQGALAVSQAWNERIPGDPLRFRDEVDLDPKAAWVLSTHLSRGMPRAAGFRELLASMGGTWKEDLPGEFAVFRRFVPPYDETRPVPRAAMSVATLDGGEVGPALLDRDAGTWWTSPQGIARGSGLELRLAEPRRLSALVLLVDLERSPLAVPWVAEAEGQVIAAGPLRHGLQWINGAPRAGKQALLVVPAGERRLPGLRLIFQGTGPPLRVGEAFAYGPDEGAHPEAGAPLAEVALAEARRGEWEAAAATYARAVGRDPDRASLYACLQRARWRAARRRWLDVESLDDGGPELVAPAR